MPSAEIVFERTVAEALRRARLLVAQSSLVTIGEVASALEEAHLAVLAAFDELHAADFGVVGDGVADDTIPMQAALDAGALQKRVVSAANLIVKITGPLHMSGPGLIFNMTSFGVPGNPGIYVTGAGYTALTVTGQPSHMMVSLYGTGNTCNGIFFDNATFMQAQKLRVVELDGFGVKFERLWDSSILDVSVEKCGNATHYAFSVNSGSDTSNMSHFGRIQVEQSNRKAMLVDGGTLCCVFDNIHSERATANAADVTWDFGGGRCRYNSLRFNALNPAAATLRLTGENTTYANPAAEGAIAVQLKGSFAPITIETPNFEGTTSVGSGGGGGYIEVIGGTVITFNSGVDPAINPAIGFTGVRLTTVTIGDCGNPALPGLIVFDRCTIGTLGNNSALSSCTLIDCAVASIGTGMSYLLRIVRGKTTATAATLDGSLLAEDARIIGNLTIKSGETLLASGRARFEGNLTQTGNNSSLIGADVLITGTPTGLSLAPNSGPNVHVLLPGNNWPRGATHWDPVATAAAVPAWRCTAAGAPGTWKAMAALAP